MELELFVGAAVLGPMLLITLFLYGIGAIGTFATNLPINDYIIPIWNWSLKQEFHLCGLF